MTPSALRRLAWGALAAYGLLTAVSIGAFAMMVGKAPPAGEDVALWQAGYEFGMRHMGWMIIVAGFVAATAGLASVVGLRRGVLGSAVVVGMTLAVELVGAATGFPFGEHGYGAELGWRVLGLIPLVIPLSWFLMLYASLGIALRLDRGPVATLVLTALGLFAWDVLMEPAMSAAYPFWFWRSSGVWYGMPLANWLSWLVIGPCIAWALRRVAGPALAEVRHDRIPEVLYALTGAMPLALALQFGLYPAAAVGGGAMVAYLAAPYVRGLVPRPSAARVGR